MTRGKRGQHGQLIIPALFVLPIFFLVTIFVIEIGKLSREKIRQQFALDAASTLEMEQYTDTLNRLAYINGVFPHRIFKGGMNVGGGRSGLFPSSNRSMVWDDPSWPIRFGGNRSYANVPDPPINFGILHMAPEGTNAVAIEEANRVAANYISVYRWLGDVATAQKLVFEQTTLKNHSLLRKSLWMNLRRENDDSPCSRSPEECGDQAAQAYSPIKIRMHYVQGFKHCPVIISLAGQTYVGELTEPFIFDGSGLFQLATIPRSDLRMLENGFVIKQPWTPDANYFGVSFGQPYVRAHVISRGGQVWPDTTPKYYTRLQP